MLASQQDLVAAIDRHLAATNTSAAAFGRRVANDPNLVSDIKLGREPRRSLLRRILAAVNEAPESRPPKPPTEQAVSP